MAEGDYGMVPWVPLMRFDGPAEGLLERCAEKIEREAPPKEEYFKVRDFAKARINRRGL